MSMPPQLRTAGEALPGSVSILPTDALTMWTPLGHSSSPIRFTGRSRRERRVYRIERNEDLPSDDAVNSDDLARGTYCKDTFSDTRLRRSTPVRIMSAALDDAWQSLHAVGIYFTSRGLAEAHARETRTAYYRSGKARRALF